MKRISKKWPKPVEVADLDNVMQYFGYGRVKAEVALRVLTKDQLNAISRALEKGGAK